MRAPVAVLVSRFPLITETFILRELIELERQGQPVRLVPLLRERPEVVHPEAESWVARALYTPFLSSAIVLSNIRALFRRPGEYLRLFFRVLVGSAGDANLFVGALGIFPKSVHLAERLAAENVAHVHAHFATHPTTAAYVISRLTGIPFSFTVHAHDIFVHRAMLAEKLRAAAFVRCISRFNETYLTEHYPDECAGKTQVVHVGVDLKSYVNGNPRAQNGETVLLTVAAFKPYKGHSTLVKACRLLNESGVSFRLALVGDGPLFQEISRQIEASGISPRIELLGNQAQQAVTEHLARATIFVLPSVVAPNGQMEGIPVALMEAMASGRPVIASSLSGVSELVEDGVHGLLVAPGDAEGLAEAIRRLGDHPELRRRMGERGRRKVEEEFELQTCVSELIELFGVRAVHQTRDSKVLEVRREKRGGALELVYKKHRSREGESRPPAERARREFQVLTELRRLDGGHRAVRPLFLDEQSAIIAMERCRGTKLDELLRRTRASLSPSHFDESERALYRAGSWLRAFQACTRGESNGAETAGQLLEESLGLVPRSQMRNGGLQIEIEALAGELIAHPRAACGHHGDFWPGNLFIDSETITAIDFEGYRQGLPLEDVAYFLLHLDMFSFQPRWWRRRRLTRAFLAGYLQGDPLDATQFRFCRLTKALQVLRTVPGRRHADDFSGCVGMDSHSFARVTMHNVVWAFLASGSGKLLSVAGLAVLARILAPDAFGLLAFGLLFIMYVDTVGDFGTGAALIARRERAEDAAQVTFVVNLCAGALWFGLSWMMAPVAAGFFHQPEAIPIVRALAWSFPLRALGNTHDALARKAMRFRVRSIPEIGIVVTRVGVSVGLALAGLGVWSLVWGHLAGYAVWSLLLWVIVEWRPRWELRTDLLKPMFSYGRGIVVTNVLAAVVHHFDFVMVGRVLGAVELGLYQMAHKIPQATITLATWTTGKVLFPAFSLAGADPELLRKSFVSSLRYLCLLVVPAAGVFVLFAEPIVTLLLGDAWARSAPVLKALALAAAFRAIGSPAGDVLKAVGRSSLLAKLALVKALVMVPAVALAAPHGGVAVAWSVAGVTLATSTMNLVVGSRIVGVGRGEVIKTFRPAMEGGKP